jgi:hypothetical protein
MKKKELKNYIILTYPFVDKKELSQLAAKFGYEREPLDVNLILLLAGNNSFLVGYAQLFKQSMEGREFKDAIEKEMLNFADGKADDKADDTTGSLFDWFKKSTDFLLGGFTQFVDLKTGVKVANAQAEAESAKAEASKSMVSIVKYIAIGTVAIVLIVVGVKMFKK